MPLIQPDTRQLLDMLSTAPSPSLHELTPADARALYRQMSQMFDRPADGLASIRDLAVDAGNHAIPVRLYQPLPESSGPLLLYFHGGGWVIGDLETHHGFCAMLALRLGLRVLAVDYRLAPEHPFPAAHEDCLFVTKWVAASPAELGAPVDGLALAGDSAGGNIAASIALQLRGRDDLRPLALLLLYPATDLTAQTASYAAYGEGYLLDRPVMEWFRDTYVPRASERHDPRVSILRAEDLAGMPPTVLLTCGLDPLRDEGRAFAARLATAGVTVRFSEAEGQIHGIATLRGALASALAPIEDSIDALRSLLGT